MAAGAIVGIPLLYTMEMWWHGMILPESHLLLVLGAILFFNFLFSLFSGFREECTPASAAMEAVTAVGIGIVFSAVILWLVGEFRVGQSTGEILGRIVFEAAPVSIGVSFANAQMQGKSRTGEETGREGQVGGAGKEVDGTGDPPPSLADRERMQLRADLKDAGATAAGAAVFALNIAPTEEVIMIATRLPYWQVAVMLLASLVLGYVILFASGFEELQVYVPSVFQHPVAETIVVGAISLVVAACLLFLLGQRELLGHPSTFLAAVVTLGLPATVGGAAGRLIL